MVEYKTTSLNSQDDAWLDASFTAMADPTRRAILARLALSDARVTEIAGDFPMSLNAVSKHIKILERAELVRRTVQGRDHVLSLNAEAMTSAAEWIDYYRQFWQDRLASLDSFFTQQQIRAKKGNKT
ncbi:ArsR/SmtB family transcription factor [Undibacterium flavidum]|uniref:Winged helix-turn-helix transcriptional regulator n=1 Tax=Undibacterium flavidum TaxID=2762297 RepID=A0ABR6YF64_9BURK|nr:metalloregulator ArsR/SmtB family transcription factor [Undibacterium flavidum]MBC3875188.1 winged helix-turn-helix transcriptional regulator [Undibacterium flavidum]